MGLAVAALTACSDDYTDWAAPQSNPQEPARTVSFAATAAAAIDYNSVKSDSVQLFKPSITASSAQKSRGYQSRNQEFKPSITASSAVAVQRLAATIHNAAKTKQRVIEANAAGKVSANDLKTAVIALYGKSDVVRDVPVTVADTIRVVEGESFTKTADITCKINLVKNAFPEFFYEVGAESGWNTAHALRGPDFDGNFEGYAYLNGAFKFRPNAANNSNDLEYVSPGKIADNASGTSCPNPGAGFYKMNIVLEKGAKKGTYSLTKINTVSLIGDFSNDGWSTDIDLTYNVSTGVWERDNVQLGKSGALKLRANHDWSLSWGGNDSPEAFDDLTSNNGKNLNVAAGTYKVQLTLSYEGACKVVFTKK